MVLIQIGVAVVYDLVRPKPDIESPDPAGLSDFKFPTVGEGRAIPIVWGRVLISGPMVVWFGDLRVEAWEESVSTGIFTSEDQVQFYDYYLTVDLVLCTGVVDTVLGMWNDGEPIPGWSIFNDDNYQYMQRFDDYSIIKVRADTLYGNPHVGGEGGPWGNIYVYHGALTQESDWYLEDKVGCDLPTYAGVSHAVMRGFYFGTSPYIKDIGIEIARWPNQLGLTGDDHRIGWDANPAAMIFELLTNPSGLNGLGIPVGNIDVDAFRSAGATLADEGLGLSMLVDTQSPAKDLILDILRHVDAVVYIEPSTGLMTMKLVRFDYTVETLPVLDETNCTVSSFARASWAQIKNQVRVQYVDRSAGFIPRTVIAQNLAAIEAAGGEVSTQDISLRGISTATNAAKACSKALAGLSYPLATLEIRGDRNAWQFRPAGVFLLNWPKLGISGMICRVTTIGKGELISGLITLQAMEDQFAIDWTAYTAPGDSEWVDPIGPVPMLTDQDAILAPYEAVKLLSVPEGSQQAVVVASRGTGGITKGYNAIVDDIAKPFASFTASAVLSGPITESGTSIVAVAGPGAIHVISQNDANFDAGFNVAFLAGGTDPDQTGLEEFIAFKTVVIDDVAGTITISDLARGCMDTAPSSFPADTRIWFMSYASGVVNIGSAGATQIKFQPYNNLGGYDLATCPTDTLTALDPARRHRIYCPTGVTFNTASYPVSISGELVVDWEHRNRLGQWGYADSGAHFPREPGTYYILKVYGELGTLVRTTAQIYGSIWTYPEAEEIAESGLGRLNNHLKVVITTYGDTGHTPALREIIWEFDRV